MITTPAVYAACKKAYSVDNLLGKWVDTSTDEATLHTKMWEVADMSVYAKDTWFIYRYNKGFFGLDLGKTPNLKLLSQISRGLEEYGESFAAFVKLKGIKENFDYEKEYKDNYLGEAEDKETFAQNYFSSWYEDTEGIDWKIVARKMFRKGLAIIKSKNAPCIFVFTK